MFFDYPVLGLLVPLLLWAVGLLVFYWVIRLAVRHGVLDASRRSPGPAGRGDVPGGPVL